jgi:hypothetical protein
MWRQASYRRSPNQGRRRRCMVRAKGMSPDEIVSTWPSISSPMSTRPSPIITTTATRLTRTFVQARSLSRSIGPVNCRSSTRSGNGGSMPRTGRYTTKRWRTESNTSHSAPPEVSRGRGQELVPVHFSANGEMSGPPASLVAIRADPSFLWRRRFAVAGHDKLAG